MLFDWDPNKDKVNREKHGLSFDEVTELFTSGADFLEIYDEKEVQLYRQYHGGTND